MKSQTHIRPQGVLKTVGMMTGSGRNRHRAPVYGVAEMAGGKPGNK